MFKTLLKRDTFLSLSALGVVLWDEFLHKWLLHLWLLHLWLLHLWLLHHWLLHKWLLHHWLLHLCFLHLWLLHHFSWHKIFWHFWLLHNWLLHHWPLHHWLLHHWPLHKSFLTQKFFTPMAVTQRSITEKDFTTLCHYRFSHSKSFSFTENMSFSAFWRNFFALIFLKKWNLVFSRDSRDFLSFHGKKWIRSRPFLHLLNGNFTENSDIDKCILFSRNFFSDLLVLA